jgi:CopG family nickel-responsive transcriptional regulator
MRRSTGSVLASDLVTWYQAFEYINVAEDGFMAELARFGVSIERNLLQRFDKWIGQHNWANRSEAIRDFIRDRLVADSWLQEKGEVVATLTYVYDHHVTNLQGRLTRLQHDHEGMVLSAMHVHLSHHDCLEVLVLKGSPRKIQKLCDHILGSRGVKHGGLVRSVPPSGV